MTPAELSAAIVEAVRAAVGTGSLTLRDDMLPAAVKVERPKNPEHGDWSSNVAMLLAKSAGAPPRDVAEAIAVALRDHPGVDRVDVAGPGFLNVHLSAAAQGGLALRIVTSGSAYGRIDALTGLRINLEFISANPTGPLHLGHTRWAAVGDALGRVLEAAGAEVVREFYVNDRGVQMDRFGASVEAAALGQPVPEDGYAGAYIADLARSVVDADPSITALTGSARLVAFREAAYAVQLDQQRSALDGFRTHFDVWYSERSLHESGAVDRGLQRLDEQGHTYRRDDALWLRTTDFGDDKDRVLVKSDGELTYFASDAAYYVDKRERGFGRCIYLLGADHHGYVHRLRALAACAGDDPDATIEILIGQLVKMLKGGQEVRLSKRAGNIITLDDLVDEVGVDAARYTLCRYPVDSPLTLDLDLMVKQTNENPVFYVQYAHARIASLLRNAVDLGVDLVDPDAFDPSLLAHERESLLLAALADYPRVVATAAELREPHRVAR
jgi:arginyl-tRNA synthetase